MIFAGVSLSIVTSSLFFGKSGWRATNVLFSQRQIDRQRRAAQQIVPAKISAPSGTLVIVALP